MSWFAGEVATLTLGCLLASACATPQQSTGAGSAPLGASAEAWVVVKFDIDPNGVPRNISVLKSSHGGEFDSAASMAVAKWKYQPNVVDGEAVWARNQKVKLVFKQADSAE